MHVFGMALLVGAILPLDLRLLGCWPGVSRSALIRVLAPVAATGLVIAVAAGILLFSVRARICRYRVLSGKTRSCPGRRRGGADPASRLRFPARRRIAAALRPACRPVHGMLAGSARLRPPDRLRSRVGGKRRSGARSTIGQAQLSARLATR
jgi:hypothetical protein